MGHQHRWCSYPPEGKLRRNKTWDEQEWDEEKMVTNARVLEDVEAQSVISCRWPMASPGRFEVPGHFQTGRDSTAPKMAEPAHGIHG